jgi:hypothetical protein
MKSIFHGTSEGWQHISRIIGRRLKDKFPELPGKFRI